MTGRNSLGKSGVEGTPSEERAPKRTLTKGTLMTGRDIPAPGDDDNLDAVDAVEKHRIRYNPSRASADTAETKRIRYNPSRVSKLDTAETERIRYNPSRASADDADL
jgi:hypothetical protein